MNQIILPGKKHKQYSTESCPYMDIQSTLVAGFCIVQTPERTRSLPRQWKIWAYRVLAQCVMKVKKKVCACTGSEKPAREIRPQHEIKKSEEKMSMVKKHRMNLSLQYTEEMKQSILCSWAEPVDDDEPLENFPAGRSTAALFIPVPKPDRPQPIILWQHAWTFTAAYRIHRKSFAYKNTMFENYGQGKKLRKHKWIKTEQNGDSLH